MIIYLNNIKRIFRKKLNITFMLIVPIVMISLMGSLGTGSRMIVCGVVDNDNTPLTQGLVKNLESNAIVRSINEEDIQKKIFGQYMEMALIIDEGFTQGILENQDVTLRTISLQETDISIPVKMSINSYINAAANIAAVAKGNETKFYEGMKDFENGSLAVQESGIDNKGAEISTRTSQLGFLVMCMLFLASMSAMIMQEDKEKKVYYRVLSAPVKVSQYMIQNLGSFFTVMIFQVVSIFLFMSVLMKVDFGTNLLGMITVSIVFSLTCVALGVCVNSISKDLRQSGVVMSLILSPMCMIGGCWWPMEFMPDLLKKIAQFVPTTWIMKAYGELLKGNPLSATFNDMLVLIGFALVFFLFASWRKVDVAK